LLADVGCSFSQPKKLILLEALVGIVNKRLVGFMTWITRIYSKGQIDRAESAFIRFAADDPALNEEIAMIAIGGRVQAIPASTQILC